MSPYTFKNVFNYYTFSFRSILEVDKVNYVFRDKKRCIFWRPIGYRLKCCIVGRFSAITLSARKKQKRQSRIDPALASENGGLLTYFFSSKNQDNSLCGVCHPQSPSFPNSLFEPIIEG
jgi:hypothetical protein